MSEFVTTSESRIVTVHGIFNSNGLSLSDQYWMKPAESNLEWKDINFFENSFSDDVGNILGHVIHLMAG